MTTAARPVQSKTTTRPIVIATLVGIVAVFGFQALGTRTLGAEAYAPIGQLWTVYFLAFTMFLLPIEQIVARRLALAGGDLTSLKPLRVPIIATVTASMAISGAFVALTLDANFGGVTWYIPAAVALAGLNTGFALTRGITAGQLRLRDYGISVAAEALTRLFVAAALLAWRPTASSLVLAMLAAAVAGLAGRPWAGSTTSVVPPSQREGRLLTGLVIGTVAAQVILASGPIVVGFLGGSAIEVSVVFVSFVLLRGPLTSSYNFLSRILHWITIEVDEGRSDAVRSRTQKGLAIGAAAAIVSGASAAWLGPWVVATIYGAEFRPTSLLMSVGAVGVVVAAGALFVGLVLIATHHTRSIAVAWTIALTVMVVGIVAFSGTAPQRFANGFLVGELAALALLTQRAFHHLRAIAIGEERVIVG